jgi:hypothetical protein
LKQEAFDSGKRWWSYPHVSSLKLGVADDEWIFDVARLMLSQVFLSHSWLWPALDSGEEIIRSWIYLNSHICHSTSTIIPAALFVFVISHSNT